MADEYRMSRTETGHMAFWKTIFGPAQADPKLQLVPLYTQIVAKAREPHWYETGQVPDSIDGRFDMIAALFSLVLLRLEQDEAQGGNMAHLTEVLVDDMDGQLREVGIGDMIVGKHIGKIMGAVGGRITAFREALADKDRLDTAIIRNIYRGGDVDAAAIAHVRDGLVAIEQTLFRVTPDDLATGNASW
jgi:cytochrome b pre-mRNA-processing protein 3